jgi:hypothetical protein
MDVFPNVRVHLMPPSAYVLNIFRRQISQDKAICHIDAELTAPTPAEVALEARVQAKGLIARGPYQP